MEFKTIGVVGAGVMGRGLAQNLAQFGMQVVLVDICDSVLASAREEINNGLRFNSFLDKQKAQEAGEADEVISRIDFTTDLQKLATVDFLVENIVEKPDLKEPLYRKLESICQPQCVFAANTSAISITRIASWTKRPEKVVGMHFMNPVPMKPVVEVIRGYHTTDESIATAKAFLKTMKKKAVVVNDMPGFVSNRVLMLTVNEAIWLVQDGVATAADVDRIFRSCFGHPMGPLETCDLIGLDTILYSLDVLYESYNEDKYRPCQLLKKMVDAGLYGRKNGKGFYEY
jgi:3-hydroxybutyryl-CoA dehydrogenase